MDVNRKQVMFYSIENLTNIEMGQILHALNTSDSGIYRKLAKLLERKLEAAESNGNV